MSTGAMFWRQEQSFVDRSRVVAIKAILEVVRVEQGKMLSIEAMPTGAVFCRQEQSLVDRSQAVTTAIQEVVRVDKGKM